MNGEFNDDFRLNFRGIFDGESVKFFTKNSLLKISQEVSFDSEFKDDTSIEYFACGVVSSMLLALANGLRKREILFDDLEASSQVFLKNSLAFLGVRGYKEKPQISKIKIKIYIYLACDFEILRQICFEILENSFIFNTLKHLIEIEISKVD